jgi:hypothetical protein
MRLSEHSLHWGSITPALSLDGQLNHAYVAIYHTVEIEHLLADLFVQWLLKANPMLDQVQARSELVEKGPLGSAKKLADICYHAGVIGPKTRHDIRCLVNLRDRYAHDRGRKMLDQEPELVKLLTASHIYKENKSRFDALAKKTEQHVLFAVIMGLKDIIQNGPAE